MGEGAANKHIQMCEEESNLVFDQTSIQDEYCHV
jgi:hypothetical protein